MDPQIVWEIATDLNIDYKKARELKEELERRYNMDTLDTILQLISRTYRENEGATNYSKEIVVEKLKKILEKVELNEENTISILDDAVGGRR